MLGTERILTRIVEKVANAEWFWLTAFVILFIVTWFLGI